MFPKLRTAALLKTEASADEASVYFVDRVQRLAQVHHHGLRDRVNNHSLLIRYPARSLLSFCPADLEHLSSYLLTT